MFCSHKVDLGVPVQEWCDAIMHRLWQMHCNSFRKNEYLEEEYEENSAKYINVNTVVTAHSCKG